MYLLSGLTTTGSHIRGLCHLVNAIIPTMSIIKPMTLTKLTSAQRKSSIYIELVFYLYCYQKMLEILMIINNFGEVKDIY